MNGKYNVADLVSLAKGFIGIEEVTAIVGDVLLDEFVQVEETGPSREYPGVQETIVLEEARMLGGAGNAAANFMSLGVTPLELYGVTGDGHTRRLVMDLLEKLDIENYLVPDPQRHTPHKIRYLNRHTGALLLPVKKEKRIPIPDSVAKGIIERLESSEAGTVIISDYDRGVVTPHLLEMIAELRRSREFRIILDVRQRELEYYRSLEGHIYLITPNRGDLEALTGWTGTEIPNLENVQEQAKQLSQELGCNVLATLSSQGMLLCPLDGNMHRFPVLSKPNDVRDVSGAGDTVVAIIAKALQAGATLPTACMLACFGAAIVVEKSGTAICELEELLSRINQVGQTESLLIGA